MEPTVIRWSRSHSSSSPGSGEVWCGSRELQVIRESPAESLCGVVAASHPRNGRLWGCNRALRIQVGLPSSFKQRNCVPTVEKRMLQGKRMRRFTSTRGCHSERSRGILTEPAVGSDSSTVAASHCVSPPPSLGMTPPPAFSAVLIRLPCAGESSAKPPPPVYAKI